MSSSKRACTKATDATQVVNCLVDGCMDDLSNCGKYHQRHKVCEAHSKSPQVLINDQILRFCQQCSRFQSLEEFDEEKRSCRKRLDGHNRRRRKRQPCLISPHNETNMLQSGCQPGHPTMAFMNPRFNQRPGWMDHSDYAHFLLSSSSGSSGTTSSHVVHPPSGSLPTTSSHLDTGLRYGSLENEFDADWDCVTDMKPHY
ncbi:squamosa promoter-binding-like protein 13A [Tanacetum coccineum]|uniref:Squamosa promoter-binding-like protein 13A n=1 Tax=Tanacetum coccineum TaxID=301880 RepID=A0ABQ5ECZ6_9ASTR